MSLPPVSRPPGAPPSRPTLNGMFDGLRVAESGMTANRFSLDISAQNIANIETTNASGGVYRKQSAIIAPVLGRSSEDADLVIGGVRIAGVDTDKTPGPMIYSPGDPGADASGYVRLPNVDMTTELLELGDARDGFSANQTVFEAIASMMRKGVKI